MIFENNPNHGFYIRWSIAIAQSHMNKNIYFEQKTYDHMITKGFLLDHWLSRSGWAGCPSAFAPVPIPATIRRKGIRYMFKTYFDDMPHDFDDVLIDSYWKKIIYNGNLTLFSIIMKGKSAPTSQLSRTIPCFGLIDYSILVF